MWFIAAKYDPSTKQNSIDTLFGFIWETQIKITLKLPHSLKYTEGKLNLVRWLKVFGLVKISRLKKEYQLKSESLWYCHETTAFDLGTDSETITNKATECTEIPRWPRNGQKVKMEASSSSWLWESWKQHREANLVRTQTGQGWAEGFPLQFRKPQTAAPPVLLSSCSGSQSSAGADSCLCSNRWFPFSPSTVVTLESVSTIPTGARDLLGVREVAPWGAKCGRCSQTLLQKRCQIKYEKKGKWRILYTVLRYNHYFNPAKPGEKRSFLAMS